MCTTRPIMNAYSSRHVVCWDFLTIGHENCFNCEANAANASFWDVSSFTRRLGICRRMDPSGRLHSSLTRGHSTLWSMRPPPLISVDFSCTSPLTAHSLLNSGCTHYLIPIAEPEQQNEACHLRFVIRCFDDWFAVYFAAEWLPLIMLAHNKPY